MLSLDTLRADRLGALGYRKTLTPNLDCLADRGWLFANAFSTDIPTQPAHTAVFTGRYGINTDVVSHFHPATTLAQGVPWLPEMMQSAGRRTGAVDHLFVMKDWFIRGYDDYMPPPGRSRAPAAVINDIAFRWIRDHAARDFFLFLHYWDPHIPYLPPAPWREIWVDDASRRIDPLVHRQLQSRPSYPLFRRTHYDHLDAIPSLDFLCALYDAEIAYLDHEIGRLIDYLDRVGILDDTIIVVFGDHGENMVEHDAWFDHAGLYDSVTHVPIIISSPSHSTGRRIDEMVELVDIMPTILELVGLPLPASLDGRSLLPMVEERLTSERRAVVLSECTWQAKRAVRTRRWKYIRSYHPGVYGRWESELYDVLADPGERTNLVFENTNVAEELDDHLSAWVARRLDGRPDPMLKVVGDGLPAIDRLASVIREDVTSDAIVGDALPPAVAAPRAL